MGTNSLLNWQDRWTASLPSHAVILVAVLAVLQGCATVSEGFTGSENEDITPFAQKTVEVLVVDNLHIYDSELLFLRYYVDEDLIELDRMQELLDAIDTFRDEVVNYSVDLVRITELYTDDAEIVAEYASNLDERVGPLVVKHVVMTQAEWDVALAEIRAQPDLLAALRQFQPIISAAGEFYEDLIAEVEDEALKELRDAFAERIDVEFGPVTAYSDRAYLRRGEVLAALFLLDEFQRGDETALVTLRESGLILDPALRLGDNPSRAQAVTLYAALRVELADNTVVHRELALDKSDYRETLEELDHQETKILAELSVARLQFATWARAHQALATGVKHPGAWMELSVGAAKKLLGAGLL
jgi:hypothetical protein